MYFDGDGHMPKWLSYLCWGLAATFVVGTGIALLVASGGSAAVAFSAAMAASCGVASSTTALTVTSFMFVGSTLGFIGATMFAARSGDMLEAGPSVLFSTATGGAYGGISGYYAYQEQIGHNPSWSTIQKKYWKDKDYSSTPIGDDGYSMVLHHPYGWYGNKIKIFTEMTRTEHIQFHQMFGYGRATGGYNAYYPFTNPWRWLTWL